MINNTFNVIVIGDNIFERIQIQEILKFLYLKKNNTLTEYDSLVYE